jgi:hypothetical protein
MAARSYFTLPNFEASSYPSPFAVEQYDPFEEEAPTLKTSGGVARTRSTFWLQLRRSPPPATSGAAKPSHHPTLVLRRVEGEWKLAIAAPWGWAPAPPLEAVGAPG